MVLENDRTELDIALDDATTIVMLISGDSVKAKAVHDVAEKVKVPWHRVFLITNVKVLKAEERSGWSLQSPDRFAVVRSDTKELNKNGFVSDLLTSTGKASKMNIQEAFG